MDFPLVCSLGLHMMIVLANFQTRRKFYFASGICPIVPRAGKGYREREMKARNTALMASFLVAAISLGGCSNQQAYIYKADEFNRDSPTFNKDPVDRENVQICYNKLATNVDELLQMAATECGRYGKTARFQGHDYLECPLTTPARATFACLRK